MYGCLAQLWSQATAEHFVSDFTTYAFTFVSVLSSQAHHSPLKRSVSLTPPMTVPSQPLGHGWMSHEDLRARGPQGMPSDHAPLSPQSSVASSGSGGSEHLEDQTSARNTFQEEGSGMKGEWERLAFFSCSFLLSMFRAHPAMT